LDAGGSPFGRREFAVRAAVLILAISQAQPSHVSLRVQYRKITDDFMRQNITARNFARRAMTPFLTSNLGSLTDVDA
jgi:hypothetical protein